MARYIAPPEPFEVYEMGCLRVYYPDNPFLFMALRGQLTYLESRFVWDTDGDIVAAEKLAQDWLRAGLLTQAAIGQGCGDVDECQQTIIDLTIQINLLNEQIEEYQNMVVTVNCNCGCCDSCENFPTPTLPPGTEPVNVPLDPNDPFGTDVPTWDDENEIPPPTYDDYPTFIAGRCKAANWFVDSYLQMVNEADLIERKLSLGASLLEVASVVLAMLPGPVGDYAGIVVIANNVKRVLSALSEVVEGLEDLGDWLQFGSDAVEANKNELVCGAYRMTSVEWFDEFFLTFFAGRITPELEAEGASPGVLDVLRDLMAPLAHDLAVRANNAFANQQIPADYVPSVDCANCESVDNGTFANIPGYTWMKFSMMPAALTSCNTATGELIATGNENGMQIDRVLTSSGNSVMGWENFSLPAKCAGVGFDFGLISYVGTGEQKYGFYGKGIETGTCASAFGLQVDDNFKIFLERTDAPDVGVNMGDTLRDSYGFTNYAAMDYNLWQQFALYRGVASGHENHIAINSIRFLVQD